MDSILIKQIVDEQLEEKGIGDGEVFILKKEWGYVVEVKYGKLGKHYLNEAFDREGNIVHPLGNIAKDTGEIYRTETHEIDSKFGKKIFATEPAVRYKELDSNHFIIPATGKSGIENALFFVHENNEVEYKGNIEGSLSGSALTENKGLVDRKQVLSTVDTDKMRNEHDYFFYSWDKNCRTSDKWHCMIRPESSFNANDFLLNTIGLDFPGGDALRKNIIEYMKENKAWLVALTLHSEDYKHERNFVCLIGEDGIPLIDLTYISEMYTVETIGLKKDRIGEVDCIKKLLQDRMDKQVMKLEENKKNINENFFNNVGLPMKEVMKIPASKTEKKDGRIIE